MHSEIISHECKGFNLLGEKGENRKNGNSGIDSNPGCLAVRSCHNHWPTSHGHHSNQPLSILLSYSLVGVPTFCSLTPMRSCVCVCVSRTHALHEYRRFCLPSNSVRGADRMREHRTRLI